MDEQLIAEWQETTPPPAVLTGGMRAALIGGGFAVAALLVAGGIYFKNWNLYLVALACALAAITIVQQNKRGVAARPIRLTTDRVIVQDTSYPLENLRGWWWSQDQDGLLVTVEHKKKRLLPVSFFSANENLEEIRQIMTKILPEIEPRPEGLSNRLNDFFRF